MQVDIKPALAHFSINAGSYVQAVQQARQLIDFHKDMDLGDNAELMSKLSGMEPIGRAQYLVQAIFGAEVIFANYDEACLTTQALVEKAVREDGIVEDVQMALMAAQHRVKEFMAKPGNKFLIMMNYNGAGTSSTPVVTEQKVVGGVETQVAVNADGGFKKGEKERLAIELYQKYLKEEPNPSNQGFIAILMKELGMTKAGATTYNYNMKKKMNPEAITAKPKRK